jgi:hypothetical protein
VEPVGSIGDDGCFCGKTKLKHASNIEVRGSFLRVPVVRRLPKGLALIPDGCIMAVMATEPVYYIATTFDTRRGPYSWRWELRRHSSPMGVKIGRADINLAQLQSLPECEPWSIFLTLLPEKNDRDDRTLTGLGVAGRYNRSTLCRRSVLPCTAGRRSLKDWFPVAKRTLRSNVCHNSDVNPETHRPVSEQHQCHHTSP